MTSSNGTDWADLVEHGPSRSRIRLDLDPAVYSHLAQVAEQQCRSIPDQVRFFVKQGLLPIEKLDRVATLPAYRVGAEGQVRDASQLPSISLPSNFSLKQESLGGAADDGAVHSDAKGVGKKRQKRGKNSYPEDFTEFWKIYQTAPSLANGQSKTKAFDEWKKLINLGWSAGELWKAIGNAISQQQSLIAKDEFCAPLPDCWRWLRDGKHESALEEIEQLKKPAPKQERHPQQRVKGKVAPEVAARIRAELGEDIAGNW